VAISNDVEHVDRPSLPFIAWQLLQPCPGGSGTVKAGPRQTRPTRFCRPFNSEGVEASTSRVSLQGRLLLPVGSRGANSAQV
jgi:hypothetical protein